MEFDIAIVSWVKVLLDLFKLSNYFSLILFFLRRKSFVFDFKQQKLIEFEGNVLKGISPS